MDGMEKILVKYRGIEGTPIGLVLLTSEEGHTDLCYFVGEGDDMTVKILEENIEKDDEDLLIKIAKEFEGGYINGY